MVKPFEDAAFAMQVGDVSDTVKTRFGFHLIKLTDRKKAETISFEDSKAKIDDYLKKQKANAEIDQYIIKLRENAKVQRYM
ncbi:MAG: peptidylprolyl isomerase, partial [Desulfobacterales bacterium]|nr:peptidylprolyl isomerase [Desulfobacterales bacterium]